MQTQEHLAQAGARWAPALRALGDERLARMVENGSETAFAAIYGRYAPVLHGYCRSLLRDEEEAGDALQNAMLKALQAMRRAGRSGPLRPWLFRIAHNESVTIIRQRSRRPGPLDEGLVAGADDAFRRAAAREQLAALLEDMQNLTEHQRGALVMRELGGLTYDEIGEALETSPLAARQAVFVARKRLSDGPAGPRRLRPALRLLVPPAPAGLLAFGVLGGGGGKALVATAAAVSVGVGSVELVVESEPAPKAKEVATAAPEKKRSAPKRKAQAQAPAAAAKSELQAAKESESSEPVRRAAAQRRAATPTVEFVEVKAETQPREEQAAAREEEPAAERAPAPQPEEVAAEPETTVVAEQPPAQAPPRHYEQARGGGKDCPPNQEPAADEASADAVSVPTVQ